MIEEVLDGVLFDAKAGVRYVIDAKYLMPKPPLPRLNACPSASAGAFVERPWDQFCPPSCDAMLEGSGDTPKPG